MVDIRHLLFYKGVLHQVEQEIRSRQYTYILQLSLHGQRHHFLIYQAPETFADFLK